MTQRALERIYSDFHRREYLALDPLEFVYRYTDPLDQEAVALIGATLAYGNVKQIRNSVDLILREMHAASGSPRGFVEALFSEPSRDEIPESHRGILALYHRFNTGQDFLDLFWCLAQSWRRHGSLGAHFGRYLKPTDADFSSALNALISEWKTWLGPRAQGTFGYLLTAPEKGSCCKRWCMFLRWMGRKDELDPGLWTAKGSLGAQIRAAGGENLRANQLVFPLDTHTGRIARMLRLTRRKTLNWRAAVEVTQKFRRFDPDDPVRFDFSLCRIGMLDLVHRVRGDSPS